MLGQLLPLFIADCILAAISTALWLFCMGLCQYFYVILHSCSNTVEAQKEPEIGEWYYNFAILSDDPNDPNNVTRIKVPTTTKNSPD